MMNPLRRIFAANFMMVGPEGIVLEDLPDHGVTCLVGPNGVGKSGILEALNWGLFGRVTRHYSGRDVVNEHSPKAETVVRLEFAQGFVQRSLLGQNPAVLTWNLGGLHKTRGDVLTDRQANLEQDLGVSWDIWRVSCYFNPDFSFLGLSPAERSRVLDPLSGADRYVRAQRVAQDEARAQRDACGRTAAELQVVEAGRMGLSSTLVARIELVQHLLVQREQELAGLVAQRDDRASRAQEAQERARVLRQEVADLQTKIQQLDSRMHELDPILQDDLGGRIVALQSRLDASLRALQQHQERLQQAQAGTCPTCQRPGLDASAIEFFRQAVDMEVTTAAGLKDAIVGAEAGRGEFEAAREQRLRLEQLRSKSAGLLHAWTLQIDQVMREGFGWNQEAVQLDHRIQQLQQAGGQADAVRAEVARMLQQLAGLGAVELGGERHLVASELQLQAHAWLADDAFAYSGIRNYLLTLVFPGLNQEIDQNTRRLSDGALSIELLPFSQTKGGNVRDEIGCRVLNSRGSSKIEGASSGEHAQYDVGVMGAFRRMAARRMRIPLAPVVLDEVFDHLHVSALPRVAEFLRYLGQEFQVFCVAHQPELTEGFDRFSVTKDATGTHVTREAA